MVVCVFSALIRMRLSTTAILTLLTCLAVLVCVPNGTNAGFLRKFEKNVLRKIAKPFKEVFKAVGKVLGIKKVRKTYKEFKQEVITSKVTFTANSYHVDKITPCPHGQHDIVQASQPVEIHFEDGVTIIQDRYCRKCGQHFFSGEPHDEL